MKSEAIRRCQTKMARMRRSEMKRDIERYRLYREVWLEILRYRRERGLL